MELVESDRNNLTLHVTNLSANLKKVQEELTEAESRYSTLQSHQLSNTPTSEATRALKEQIKELEMRVLRRTEEIGIHQHDIRRMETNLRLQEERLIEMTVEMETLAAQKEAMVEDCAEAREARDEALARMEDMELEADVATVRLKRWSKLFFRQLGNKRVLSSSEKECARFRHELDTLTATAEHSKAVELLERRAVECEGLEPSVKQVEADFQQTTCPCHFPGGTEEEYDVRQKFGCSSNRSRGSSCKVAATIQCRICEDRITHGATPCNARGKVAVNCGARR